MINKAITEYLSGTLFILEISSEKNLKTAIKNIII